MRDRVKDEVVALKLHVGNNIGYSTIHPVFVRKVVNAIKEGGGKPFVCDVDWDVSGAETRGYTAEVLGCPVLPVGGIGDKYYYAHKRPFKNIQEWKVAGLVQDATFMINFAHIKGHPSCGFGGVFKNIALGCMIGETRSTIHDTCHYEPYWFKDKCPDEATRKKLIQVCPHGAIVEDKNDPEELHLHIEQCNQCGRCLEVAPPGSLKIDAANFHVFQEACANSVDITLSTFEPGKITNLALATQMTPVCDCFGFTGMAVLPDAGIFGSDDIVALDQAVLDMTGRSKLIEENVPTFMEVHTREGHPFQVLHGPLKDPYLVLEYGEALGLGSRDYELIDILPVDEVEYAPMGYIPASAD
ncbi:MAG: DUF362 domain-containing protein [Anaerolineales bacterium]|nr:DUF362 domain-containing protein [Anaerolineales bacterium]